ncbi:MAG: type II toxin-antitoxin system RelE/ParE family toxin [Acidobacteriota bacterium]|nr:type II toxin-antitoxin system RelE/ParE family toxin [Acidobacteriota bacterium]
MILLETAKFAKLRKKIRDESERMELKAAILAVRDEPSIGKKLKGELGHLRSYAYSVRGQARRLVYHWEKDTVTLYSFGPRQGAYK